MSSAVYCPECGHCESECVIASDAFDDGATTGWTVAGTVTEAGGLMDMAGASTAIFDTETGGVDELAAVTTFPLNEDTDAELRLRVCYSDANNFLFGAFAKDSGAGTIRVGQVVGGVESWLTDAVTVDDTDAELDARGTLCLSFEPGELQEGESLTNEAYADGVVTAGTWTDEENMLGPDDDTGGLGSSIAPGVQAIFGFSSLVVPPGSTIDGIAVGIRCRRAAALGSITLRTLTLGIGLLSVGDDRGGGQTVPNGAYGVLGDGDATDHWNAGLTWEDIPNLSVHTDWDTSASGSQLDIDSVHVQIWFTTPDRQPGKLTFTYINTGTPQNTNCVTEFSAENPAGGRKTGIEVVAGDWDFTEYQLACAACTACPPDCTLCADGSPVDETYVLDLGDGGWTDDDCDACDLVAGEYEVSFRSPGDTVFGPCLWHHRTSALGICAGGAATLNIYVTLDDELRWHATIAYGSPNQLFYAQAAYVSEPMTDDSCASYMPVTLTKEGEFLGGGGCGGALPETITLDQVA